jgi:hypothetical protein
VNEKAAEYWESMKIGLLGFAFYAGWATAALVVVGVPLAAFTGNWSELPTFFLMSFLCAFFLFRRGRSE